MQPKTKKIIIILIVAAVAAYLLWKNGVFGKKTVEDNEIDIDESTGSGLSKSNLEDCITAAFGNDSYAKSYAIEARKVYASATTPAKIADYRTKASGKGYTIEQMAVVDAAWNKKQKYPDAAHIQYLNTVVERVSNM